MRKIADSVGAYLMADMAHISGLVRGGVAGRLGGWAQLLELGGCGLQRWLCTDLPWGLERQPLSCWLCALQLCCTDQRLHACSPAGGCRRG